MNHRMLGVMISTTPHINQTSFMKNSHNKRNENRRFVVGAPYNVNW